MSDYRSFEDTRRERGSNSLYVFIVVLMLINAAFSVFVFAYSNRVMSDLRSSNSKLESSINGLSQEVQNLKSQLALGQRLNSTETQLLPQIYNETMLSVVLIRVSTSSGSGLGSGFVYDSAGHILTNNHVVEAATSIDVTFIDGTIVPATRVGTDPYSDLAVIQIKMSPSLLHPLVLGKSSDLLVGETVIAIGNPYGFSNSMTVGVVSQLGREVSSTGGYVIVDVIQTDAVINPGNSGGPLLNLEGQVIGMNSYIYTMTGEWQGIGFAVPSDTIKREVQDIIGHGSYQHPWLGVTGTDVTPNIAQEMNLPETTRGALIVDVRNDGPSAGKLRGGTRDVTIEGRRVRVGGDVITSIEGNVIKSFYDVILYLERNKHPGDQLSLSVLRGSQNTTVAIKIGVRPPPSS